MICETSWLPRASCSDSAARSLTGDPATRVAGTPKVSPTSSPIRPPIFPCVREAALRRLTRVLPSRLASTRLSSSAILSNSASRSFCSLTASSTFSAAGGGGGGGFAAPPWPITVVWASVSLGLEGFLGGDGGESLGLGGEFCDDSASTTCGTADGAAFCFLGSDGAPAPPEPTLPADGPRLPVGS